MYDGRAPLDLVPARTHVTVNVATTIDVITVSSAKRQRSQQIANLQGFLMIHCACINDTIDDLDRLVERSSSHKKMPHELVNQAVKKILGNAPKPHHARPISTGIERIGIRVIR